MFLNLLLITPMLGIFTICTGISYELSSLDIRRIKTIALSTSIFNLFIYTVIAVGLYFWVKNDDSPTHENTTN